MNILAIIRILCIAGIIISLLCLRDTLPGGNDRGGGSPAPPVSWNGNWRGYEAFAEKMNQRWTIVAIVSAIVFICSFYV